MKTAGGEDARSRDNDEDVPMNREPDELLDDMDEQYANVFERLAE
jgi:hypothetical protein